MSAFDENGNYNRTNWKTGDKITADKLNKIEDALESINTKVEEVDTEEVKDIIGEVNLQLEAMTEKIDDMDGKITQTEVDMDAMVADVEADLEGLHAKDDELSAQLEHNTHYVNIKKYKHLVKNNDWTLALQTAINENNKVVITENINIYGMVTLGDSKVIELGACSVSKPSAATDNTPIFWLKGSNNAIRGQGQSVSVISSNIHSPEGVVRIGHSTDTLADLNCVYNQISDLHISGGGNDGMSVALMMRNAETDGRASYFHTINNLRISNAHMGICIKGYSNANLISNIQLYKTGGDQEGGGICFLGIDSKVPMENSIHAVFHHKSSNANTLLIDCNTFYNKMTNILSEQGGTEARCIYITENGADCHGNTFVVTANVTKGNNLPSDFRKRNIIMMFNDIMANRISVNEIIQPMKSQKAYSSITNFKENQLVNLLTLEKNSINTVRSALCTIKMYMYSGTNVENFMHVGEQKFKLTQTTGNSPKVTVLNEVGYPMTWTGLQLDVTIPNNGTNTQRFVVGFELEIFGHQWSSIIINENFKKE